MPLKVPVEKVGAVLTVTVAVFIPLQEEFDPLIVYIVVDTGLTVMLLELELVGHVYVVAPLAVRVVVSPGQIVGLFTEIVIAEPILIETVCVLVHAPFVPVT